MGLVLWAAFGGQPRDCRYRAKRFHETWLEITGTLSTSTKIAFSFVKDSKIVGVAISSLIFKIFKLH